MIEISEELELSDDQLENISGGCTGTTLGLGGLHLGGGLHYSFGGFYGGPVVMTRPVLVAQALPVQQVQYEAVVAQPVAQTVAATSCSQGVTLAAGC